MKIDRGQIDVVAFKELEAGSVFEVPDTSDPGATGKSVYMKTYETHPYNGVNLESGKLMKFAASRTVRVYSNAKVMLQPKED